MNLEEFSNEFDILMDNARNGESSIRSLNEYDKSIFLTEAQEQLVKSYYDIFEQSEKAREALKNLITSGSTKIYEQEEEPEIIAANVRHYKLNSDIMFIIYEWCTIESDKKCLNNKKISVVPTTYDDLYKALENPFRGPSDRRILRIDRPYNTTIMGAELIIPDKYTSSSEDITYSYRYIRKPKPIILENLGSLTIDNESNATECELDASLHRTILEIAVKLALSTKANVK